MRLRYVALGILAASLSLFAAACATTGGAAPAGGGELTNTVSAVLLSTKQVQSQYGYSFTDDPFIAPGPSILPTYYDFLVVRLTIGATKESEFHLAEAKAEDIEGTVRADYANRAEFTHYVDQASMQGTPSATMRHDKVGWYYLPKDRFQVKRGWHSYLIVLIGKHPIGNNVTINLVTSLGGKIQSIQLPVPAVHSN